MGGSLIVGSQKQAYAQREVAREIERRSKKELAKGSVTSSLNSERKSSKAISSSSKTSSSMSSIQNKAALLNPSLKAQRPKPVEGTNFIDSFIHACMLFQSKAL